MSHLPLIVSPSLNHDWNEFLQNKPDLTDVIMWLQNKDNSNNLDIQTLFNIEFSTDDPDDVFEESVLDEWAEENGYKQELSDFDEEQILKYVKESDDPESVYGYDRLEEWAIFNDYILKDKVIDVINESELFEKEEIIDLLDRIK